MPVRVVDASALGALIYGEPKAGEIARALADSTIVAPALLWFELASVTLKKIKAHPTQEGQILKAFSLAHRLAIEIIKVDHLAVIELGKKANITTYDASYLWLVLHLQGELVTLDKKLRRVAAHSLP